MTRRWQRLILAAFLAVTVPVAAAAVTTTQTLAPGDSLTVTCSTSLTGTYSANEATLRCQSTPTPTTSPSPIPSGTPTPTPSASATVAPSASVTPSPTPTPSANNVCTGTSLVGYGAGTVGGQGGRVFEVDTVAELRTAIGTTGPRIVNMAPGLYDLNGDLAVAKPFLTVNGNSSQTKRGSWKITASQVIIRDVASRSGDQPPVNGADVDSFTLNGNRAPIDHIVLDHVEGIWGPDVSGAMLGRVTDVTIQCSIFGEGLLRSSHPESGDNDGHGLAFNVASEDATSAAERITFYGVLFTTSEARMPRIIGAAATDIIDSVFYNATKPPQGNPQSLNLIGNTWKKGPAPVAAGFTFDTRLWQYQPGGHGAFGSRLDGRVYIADAQYWGFVPATPSGDDARVLRSTPLVPPSVPSIGYGPAYAMVTTSAGLRRADATTQRLRSNVVNGTGTYVNGQGFPAPNPTWQ